MTKLLAFVFDSLPGRVLVGALGLAALVGVFAGKQRSIGAAAAVAKIERSNDNASKIGKRGAAGTTDVRVRGQRDPSTRDE